MEMQRSQQEEHTEGTGEKYISLQKKAPRLGGLLFFVSEKVACAAPIFPLLAESSVLNIAT